MTIISGTREERERENIQPKKGKTTRKRRASERQLSAILTKMRVMSRAEISGEEVDPSVLGDPQSIGCLPRKPDV